MKKLFITAWVAVVLGTASVQAQQRQDTTSYTNDRLKNTEDDAQDAATKTGNEIKAGSDDVKKDVKESAQSADHELDQATDQMEKQLAIDKDNAEKAGDKMDNKADQAINATENAAESTKSAADKSGKKLNKGGRTGAAEIKDEMIQSKVGPNGEPIFIDEHEQYYYIDQNGQRVNVEKKDLKDKA